MLSSLNSMTRSIASMIAVSRLGGLTLCAAGLFVLGAATVVPAQISRFPDQRSPESLDGILSGIGAGGDGARVPNAGVRVESEVATEAADHALRAELGYIRWERWWHDSLYDILRSDRAPRAAADSLVLVDVMDVLRQALVSGSETERRAAAIALSRLAPEGVVGDLLFALPGASEEVQSSIILALGLSGSEAARSYLDSFLRDNRFGRGTMGSRRQPVSRRLRCVAALAMGLLPAREDCTAIHEILSAPGEHHPDLYLAAALGLGLQSAGSPRNGPGREGRFGPIVTGFNPCTKNLTAYLALLDRDDVDARARGALLDAILSAAPAELGVLDKALEFLLSDDVVLARSAAVALQRIDAGGKGRALDGLWSRVADRSDATASGLALVTIGRIADADSFRKLVTTDKLNPALDPYQAFALAEAARIEPQRRASALIRLRSMLGRSLESDQAGLGGIVIALGLLHDEESIGRLSAIVRGHDSEGVRAAATLAASLVNGTLAQDDLGATLSALGRDAGFLVHDGALALALAQGSKALDPLTRILALRHDEFSLGGIARAIGLVGDPKALPRLVEIASSMKESAASRAFAIGAIGLLLERADFPMHRLRDIAPLPLVSPTLRDVLSHL